MHTYRITFHGRERGAIGQHVSRVEEVKADTAKEALLKLYNDYDSVHFPVAVNVATGLREECR